MSWGGYLVWGMGLRHMGRFGIPLESRLGSIMRFTALRWGVIQGFGQRELLTTWSTGYWGESNGVENLNSRHLG